MKIFLRYLWLAAFATVAHAAAPHPTVLTVKYKAQLLPVAKVIGTDPVVMVNGKEKRIRTEPSYLPQRADGYSRESVQFLTVSLGGMELQVVADESAAAASLPSTGPRFGTTYFKATLKSKNTLKGGFIAIVMYSPLAFITDLKATRPEIMVHDLPDLPAGQPVSVDFSAAVFDGLPAMRYFIQVFDGEGREVPTALMSEAWKYYHRLERSMLPGAITRYREKFKGADHDAVPVVMPKPLLPESMTPPATEVFATMTVVPDGTVDRISVRGLDNTKMERLVVEALGGWLFLPKLEGGEPVECQVQVPVQF